MLSSEYRMLQETYIGSAPLFEAKTRALLREEQEDKVALGMYLVKLINQSITVLTWSSQTHSK
jgi:hypothetical protein